MFTRAHLLNIHRLITTVTAKQASTENLDFSLLAQKNNILLPTIQSYNLRLNIYFSSHKFD